MEEAAGAGAAKLNVVLFPWLAFGHLIPYLELAKRLAARGHAVTFLSTPRNLARLPPVPPRLSSRINLVALPAPKVDGLPKGAESTADVPPEMSELIKKALDALAVPFATFLSGAVSSGTKPDWIVIDFCHHWLPEIADAHGVPCATFFIVQPTTIAFFGTRSLNAATRPRSTWEDFTAPPEWCGSPSSSFPPAVAYRRHEAEWVAGAFRTNASGVSDLERQWQVTERSRLTIFRSCDEIEPGVFALLTDLLQKPAVPAGVLFQPDFSDDDGGYSNLSGERSEVLRWLDCQPHKSVIYVALGSEAPLTANNLHELALGLELAGVRFLWALRKPAGISAPDADAAALLPPGFEERTRGRGLVRTGWVPQVRVLAHAAVGAFLTHCGWGSTIESLVLGRPMVMLPFVVDQGLIARTMALRGVGVEVPRDDGDGSFVREDVAAAGRRVMGKEEGKVFASNAAKLKEVLGDQPRQDRYVDRAGKKARGS
ncbi:hypothetical protein EJB05_03965, partial [Eragrostis curvula]